MVLADGDRGRKIAQILRKNSGNDPGGYDSEDLVHMRRYPPPCAPPAKPTILHHGREGNTMGLGSLRIGNDILRRREG